MTTMNISLPDDMKAFVDEQVRARGYMSSSEYIRDLIRKQKDFEDFRAMIQEGIGSGPAEEAYEERMAAMRARISAAS